jgi:hypothetical protein
LFTRVLRLREIGRGLEQKAATSRRRIAQPSLTFLLFTATQHCIALQHDDRSLQSAYLLVVRQRLAAHRIPYRRRSTMKRLIAIIALALSMSAVVPAFAHATTFEDATHGAGIASQS